jgi:hypothetical protein
MEKYPSSSFFFYFRAVFDVSQRAEQAIRLLN